MKKLLLVLVLGLFLLSGCGVVDPDITPPVITLLGENPLNLNVNDQYVEPGAIALDDKDGNITHKIIIGGDVVDTNTPGTYIVTYFVKDRAGNMAQVTRTVNVKVSEQMLKLLKEYTGKEKVTRWPDGVVLVNDCTRETKSIWAQINDVIDGPVVFQATYIIDDYDYELQIAIEYIKLNPSLRPFSAGWISIDGHEYKVSHCNTSRRRLLLKFHSRNIGNTGNSKRKSSNRFNSRNERCLASALQARTRHLTLVV